MKKKILIGVAATLCVGVAMGVMTTGATAVSAAPQLVYYREMLSNPPACVLALEEAKVKNMTYWEYCRVDDEYDAWYFMGDGTGTARKNPEIRFVADGVQTSTKPYDLPPMTVGSFSFDYCIVNDDPQGVDDIASENYIVQILGSDGLYPVMLFDIEADGDWHTITVDESTSFYGATGGDATTYGQYQDKFCGFLFKMGGLDGEFMIKDIVLYDSNGDEMAPEVETPDGGETSDDSESVEDSVSSDESVSVEDSTSSDESVSVEESTSSDESVSVEESTSSDEDEISNEDTQSSVAESTSSDNGNVSSEIDNTSSDNDSVSSSQTTVFVAKKMGCGSFGVGAMTLGALAAAGLVLSVGKKKRK